MPKAKDSRGRFVQPVEFAESAYTYLLRTIKELQYDPAAPWDSYPCLEWTRGRSVAKGNVGFGYGIVSIKNRQFRVTRVVHELVHGPLTDGLGVMHLCDFPPCFHPGHITAGTQKENVHDCVKKKRHCFGETHGMRIITSEIAREIRCRYEGGERNQKALGKEYGVSGSLVWRIVHGHLWNHS